MTMMMTEEAITPESRKEEYEERHLNFAEKDTHGYKFGRIINENKQLAYENDLLRAEIDRLEKHMVALTDAARAKVGTLSERIEKLEKALIDATIA